MISLSNRNASNKCIRNRVVFPYFLVPAFFIGFVYWELAIGYLNTGRDLRRMESNTRSPIFSDFGEVLEGIVTIRAFSAEKRFLNNVFVKIDTTTKVGFFYAIPFSSGY
jgi:ABC-type multidrug transport system fused ATPase/permease subunit